MKIKNWNNFQHFKDRRPPWIKLHRDILEQRDISTISDAAFRVLVGLWLLASEDKDMEGRIPSPTDISFRLRMSITKINNALDELSSFLEQDDNKMISPRYQDDVPETETETETEKALVISEKENDSIPYQKIVDLYHDSLPDLPKVAKLTPKRKAQIRRRWIEDLQSLEQWGNFFDHVSQSDFLMGRKEPTNGRPVFRADIEWLTNQTNITKIAEGKYHV